MVTADVVILGAGPAGATAALLLRRWGHRVRLQTKAGASHRLAVSLPPSCAKLFAEIGIADAIDRAAFIRSNGNTVWWGDADARVEPFAKGAQGWQLDVADLAGLILEAAVAAGVEIERGVVTEQPIGFVLDCTGRSSVVARAQDVRRDVSGLRTVALIGEWRRATRWPVPDDTHTLIESYGDGWMWSVPASEGTRHVAAMVDPQRSGLARQGSAKQVYLAEIAKTSIFRALVADAELVSGPWGWDASQYYSTRYCGDDWLLAGDAGSFIDPLSSAGVKKALASGWLAAITAHTCLTKPDLKPHALSFFDTREREIAEHFIRESTRFLASAAATHQRAFWEERSEDLTEPADDRAAIVTAFEALKAAGLLNARPAAALRIESRPCVAGNEIALAPHVVDAQTPGGIRYLHGVQVVRMIELAPGFTTVPDLYEGYVVAIGEVPLPDFLTALATAFARGWLVSE